ncbi:MAG TPA: adenosylcobalamin-dependent ribonucleoside-diphosphate reductase [Xanthobacteraceae bacterium]|nr:adenosylcobalamin-dependent ribonucleoside-diphosphate reductase [Xanthobacteraceae bacterium]
MDSQSIDISRHVWETKYRHVERGIAERSIADTWRRVARALAATEPVDAPVWAGRFFHILQDFKFLPGGRIQAGAGTSHDVTLFNCFVMGPVEDSVPGIFRALQEAAVTMQKGGGIGIDFSTLRPRGTKARETGSIASGPLSFMQIWDSMCGTILSTGSRRGAMMATLRCDHPDIEEFVTAKREPGRLRRFNLSVLVTDPFMAAVRSNTDWALVFPAAAFGDKGETVIRHWSNAGSPVPCRVIRRMPARQLWNTILRASYDCAEPGVLFIDRINHMNNLAYREHISATNPCGEIPLPPYGACDLGSLNLTRFVLSPFTPQARFDIDALVETTAIAVRLLDNVIDASRFPLPQQRDNAQGSRRIGLGITGLADALVMLGLAYGEERALTVVRDLMRTICHAAYKTSIALAGEKGSFVFFERENYLQSKFIRTLPDEIRDGIARRGIRNSHLLAIAPTGTISLLAGNVSSGLEPIFDASYTRKVLGADGTPIEFTLTDCALNVWRQTTGATAGVPAAFVTAADLPVRAHLETQAALQPSVDNSISKTINVSEDCPFGEFSRIYDLAYDLQLKGCTTFRPNPVTGAVLGAQDSGLEAPHCCTVDREAD